MTNLFAMRQLRQFGRADEGQAQVLTSLAPVALMLMAGLGVDVPRYEKQQMHKEADAGAIAGASALTYGGQVTVAAQNLGDGPLNGTALLPYQPTSEKHGANVRNPAAARKGTIWFSWRYIGKPQALGR